MRCSIWFAFVNGLGHLINRKFWPRSIVIETTVTGFDAGICISRRSVPCENVNT